MKKNAFNPQQLIEAADRCLKSEMMSDVQKIDNKNGDFNLIPRQNSKNAAAICETCIRRTGQSFYDAPAARVPLELISAKRRSPRPFGRPTDFKPSMMPGPGTRWALVMCDQSAIL